MDTKNGKSRLRAEFREVARTIIANDREARKFGISQNTIGAIENALMKAHALGRDSASSTHEHMASADGTVTWIEVPPRARSTLWFLSICFRKSFGINTEAPDNIEQFLDAGRSRWRLVSKHGRQDTHTCSDGAVRPLIKLGLLEPVDESLKSYRLTSQGIATCREYWQRFDANDPTLPIESMR